MKRVICPAESSNAWPRSAQEDADAATAALQLNQGTIYAALLRLQQRGWITSAWGTSDNNRRAKYYSITRLGKKQLAAEESKWKDMAAAIGRVMWPEEV